MIRIYSAYGREVNTLEDLKHYFDGGKDFKFYNGMYFSKRDRALMLEEGMTILCVKDRFCIDLRTMKYFLNNPNIFNRIL